MSHIPRTILDPRIRIEQLSVGELEADEEACWFDACICRIALAQDIQTYANDLPVFTRLQTNLDMIRAIQRELKRRNLPIRDRPIP